MTNEELEREIKRLKEQIEDQINILRSKFLESEANKKLYEVKVPEDIENYYYVDELGGIYLVKEILNFDEYEYELIYQRGLAFKTREEAERYDKERQLIQKIKDCAKKYNGGWIPDWESFESIYRVGYNHKTDFFEFGKVRHYQDFTKLPYFKSEEIAREFIEVFGEEIKEVLC